MKLTCLPPRLSTASTSRLTGQVTGKRESAHARGYTYQWQKARERYLRANPMCVFCQKEGKVTEARVVDHIVPHGGNDRLFWNEKNWQGLCKRCHDSIKQKIEHNAGYRG